MRLPALPAFFHFSDAPATGRRARRLLAIGLCALLSACGGGGGSTTTNGAASTGSSGTTGAVVVSISATPTATTTGQQISLTWNAANASSCTASGAWSGSVATSGTQAVTAGAVGTSVYTLTCNGVSNSVSVPITAPVATPTVSIVLSPNSVATGAASTLTWSSTNASACTAGGSWSGSRATSGTLTVSQSSAGSYPYTITCTSAGGSATGSTALTVTAAAVVNNTAVINVDNGPSGGGGSINVPFVSVTVCVPGTTTCQTIDHVMVDTGSYGLRLMAPVLNSALALPALSTPSGAAAGECGQFASGYTWGAVRSADIQIAGETAASVPVQVIGDTGSAYASVPKACSDKGANLGTVSALGANGILGVGLFKQDCGSACVVSTGDAHYFSCGASGSCSASAMALASQVSNPVAYFANDNNGVLIVMPSVPTGGATSLTGQLIFGINTQSNNMLGTETVYAANSLANFTTVYKNQTATNSFIDSGSNGYFFNDSSIATCTISTDFYCPASPLALSAVNKAASGGASGTVTFTIENVDTLGNNVTAASVGGSNSTRSFIADGFDWGLPFFFGRRVFVALENTTTAAGTGPYWAY